MFTLVWIPWPPVLVLAFVPLWPVVPRGVWGENVIDARERFR